MSIFVSDWKRCYRWLSMQFLLLAALAEMMQEFVPLWFDLLPVAVQPYVTPTLVSLAMIGRLIKQGDPHAVDSDPLVKG